MMTTIDTNTVCTDKIDVLTNRGVTAVGRYYSTFHPGYRILRAEAQAIIAAGIKIFVVFEDCANPVLDATHGHNDAKKAMAQADDLGQPEGSAIYFAAENLPDGYSDRDVKNAKTYFTEIKNTINNRFKLGVYSNGIICDALLQNICDYAWLSASTSFEGSAKFYADGNWALAQKTPVDQDWDGVSVDIDEAKADFGAFGTLRPLIDIA